MKNFDLTQEAPFSPETGAYYSLSNTPKKLDEFFSAAEALIEEQQIDFRDLAEAMICRKKYLPNNPMNWKQFLSDTTLEGTASFWLVANDVCGFVKNLDDLPELHAMIATHKDDMRFLNNLQNWITWYCTNKFDLMIVNYGPFHSTPLINVRRFFLAFWQYLNTDKAQLSQSFLSHSSPAWYGFVKWMSSTYGVSLLPTEQQIVDGRSMYNAVERVYKVESREKPIEKPKEYFTWGYKSKFLWDLEHIPLFRSVQFKNDPELQYKYEILGGVTEEFIAWIKER